MGKDGALSIQHAFCQVSFVALDKKMKMQTLYRQTDRRSDDLLRSFEMYPTLKRELSRVVLIFYQSLFVYYTISNPNLTPPPGKMKM